MRVSVIVSFFALFHILATHAMWESDWDLDEPTPHSDTRWLAAFDNPLVAKTFETLEVSNILVRHILPTIMANYMEWGMTVRADSLEAQVHAITLSDTQDQERIREGFLWSDLNTLNRNVLLSDLANAGFSYEKAKRFRYSNVLLVLMAYHKSVLDIEKKKTFSGYFSTDYEKVKNEVDSILEQLTLVMGAVTLQDMKDFALSVSEKTWNEIKTLREGSSLNEPHILPALIVCPGNIKGHDSVYKRVVKYVYHDLRTLQLQELQPRFADFHKRLELGFVKAGLMIGPDNFDYISGFLNAVLDVIENRGLVFVDRARAYQNLTARVQSLGPIDEISFESMASVIIKFCNYFEVCSQDTLPAGRALVVESMVWLVKMYRAGQENRAVNYVLQVLSTLFSKLSKDDSATCYSLTGVYPPHVVAKNQQPARPPEQQPALSTLFSKRAQDDSATCYSLTGVYPPHAVAKNHQPARPPEQQPTPIVIDIRPGYADWTYRVIEECGGGHEYFVAEMRKILSERYINDIKESNYGKVKEQKVQMLLKVNMMGNAKQLETLFEYSKGRPRFIINQRRQRW